MVRLASVVRQLAVIILFSSLLIISSLQSSYKYARNQQILNYNSRLADVGRGWTIKSQNHPLRQAMADVDTYDFKYDVSEIPDTDINIIDPVSIDINPQNQSLSYETKELSLTKAVGDIYNISHVSMFINPDKDILDPFLTLRTTTCLDFQYIIDALQNMTITALGRTILPLKSCHSVEMITKQYNMIDELAPQMGLIPIKSKMDIIPLMRSIEYNGAPPEVEELSYFADTLQQIGDLRSFILTKDGQRSVPSNNARKIADTKSLTPVEARLPLFIELANDMNLPEEVVDLFEGAFDDENNINADKFPDLGRLRTSRDRLKFKILSTLQSLIKSDSMREKLADTGYIELEDRYCILIKNTYKKGVGIVHGSSNTGKTLYVEPFEIVEASNEYREIKIQIKIEENRILYEMVKAIAVNLRPLKAALQAVAEIDVLMAKAKLGRVMQGVIPEVQNEGMISVRRGRHPVLLLRGVDPVENAIELSNNASALVISGPNAGGKTVILKMAGLFALMTRHSIPIPAAQGARIDLLDVMADIGDMQTVSDDLSTFSGHLTICRKILEQVSRKIRPSLVLLDEIGTGTDPAQGAALAQAVLEELVNLGSRVIVTTHYQRIKELAADDVRFRVAAMEFIDNRPTYRLRLGYIGESYAFEAGRRMAIPEHVLERALSLLDNESRKILALQKRLEEETEKSIKLQYQLLKELDGLTAREREIESNRLKLEKEIDDIRKGKVDDFLHEVRKKERALQEIYEKARIAAEKLAAIDAAALYNNKGTNATAKEERSMSDKALQEAKMAIKDVRIDTETEIIQSSAANLGTPLPSSGEPLLEGTTLVVLEQGSMLGKRAVVAQRNKGRGRVLVRIGGVEIKMDRHLLGIPHVTYSASGVVGNEALMSSKEKKLLKMLQEEVVDPDRLLTKDNRKSSSESGKSGGKVSGKRTGANTIDIRRCQMISEAQRLFDQYIEKLIDSSTISSPSIVYIQHSSSSQPEEIAFKTKFRIWVKSHPLVSKSYVADGIDGGDAFTVVELDLDD